MLVREAQSILFRSRRNIWFIPNDIMAQNPSPTLHRDRESRGYQQQLLLLTVVSHRRPPALSLLIAQTLPAVFSNARPSCEISVAEIYPKAAVWFQQIFREFKNLKKMCDVPFGKRLKTENAAMIAIPSIARSSIQRLIATPII